MSNALVKSLSIEAFLRHREAIEDHIARAHQDLREAEKSLSALAAMAPDTDTSLINRMFDSHHNARAISFMKDDGPAQCLHHLDQNLWGALVRESGTLTFMDAAARREWDESLRKGDFPPLNAENIKATITQLYDDRAEYFERGVENVFRKLSWSYKSNSPVKFGRRIVVECFHTTYGGGGHQWFTLNSRVCNEIDDLLRVFHLLDGRPEPDARDGMHSLFYKEVSAEDGRGERVMDYFRIKYFKKGTAHLYFLRPDLVDELNKIIARRNPDVLAHSPSDAWNPAAEKEARQHRQRGSKEDFFATPSAVADVLLDGLAFDADTKILEPSAGTGALVEAIRQRGGDQITAYEKNTERARQSGATCADFLDLSAKSMYDVVVMNPPFSHQQDVDHVSHAWDFVKPGGHLRAVMSAGAMSGTSSLRQRFQQLVKDYGEVIDLPERSFAESGTGVNAVVVRLRKTTKALP